MATAFDQVTQQSDAQKKAALQAIAQGGAAGAQAMADGQAQVAGAQATALDRMAKGALVRDAPAASIGQAMTVARSPGDLAQTYMAGSAERYQQDATQAASANSYYMDQVGAATSAHKAQADSTIGIMKARWEHQAAVEDAAQKAQAEEDSRYGGYQTAGEYENAVTAQAQLDQQAAIDAIMAQAVQADAPLRAAQNVNTPNERRLMREDRQNAGILASRGTSSLSDVPSTARAPSGPVVPSGVRLGPGGGVSMTGTHLPTAAAAPAARQRNPVAEAAFASLQGVEDDHRRAQAQRQALWRATNAGQADISDPANFYNYQQGAAIGMGGDPFDAVGRFAPPTPDETLGQLGGVRDWQAYQESGGRALSYGEWQKMIADAQPEDEQFSESIQGAREAAQGIGMNPATADAMAASPEYQAGVSALVSYLNDPAREDVANLWSNADVILDGAGIDDPTLRELLRAMFASEFL